MQKKQRPSMIQKGQSQNRCIYRKNIEKKKKIVSKQIMMEAITQAATKAAKAAIMAVIEAENPAENAGLAQQNPNI